MVAVTWSHSLRSCHALVAESGISNLRGRPFVVVADLGNGLPCGLCDAKESVIWIVHGLCRLLCVEESGNVRRSLVWLVEVCAIARLNDHCSYPCVCVLLVGFGRDCRYTAGVAVVVIANRKREIFFSWE